MAQDRRKWSGAQKFQIIQEAEQAGLTETLRKYNPLGNRFFTAGEGCTTGRACKGSGRTTKP